MMDDPLEVFRRRCRELSRRCATGELTRPAAAERMQQAAEALGIVELIGQDRAQGEILAAIDAPRRPIGTRAAWQERVSSADVLQGKTFKPMAFVLPGLIPAEGVTLIASKPKTGKSWLALDLCIAVAGDRHVLGNLKPAQGDVLYLALEDSDRRLQHRVKKLLPGASGWPAGLRYATSWRRIDEGGLEDLRAWCQLVKKPTLIVVDVLARIRPASKGNRPAYEVDYAALIGLHALSLKLGVAILVVHHVRKMAADDAMDTVSGSFGLVGAVDTILVLERRGQGMVLDVRGRDVESAELALQFGKETCRWAILGQAAEMHQSAERGRVLEALEAGPLPPKEIMVAAELKNRNALDCLLYKMVKRGQLERAAGKYALRGQKTDRGTDRQTDTKLIAMDGLSLVCGDNLSDPSSACTPSLPEKGEQMGQGSPKQASKTNGYDLSANLSSDLSSGARGQKDSDDGLDIPEFLRRSPPERH
jgi:hypothetical protein